MWRGAVNDLVANGAVRAQVTGRCGESHLRCANPSALFSTDDFERSAGLHCGRVSSDGPSDEHRVGDRVDPPAFPAQRRELGSELACRRSETPVGLGEGTFLVGTSRGHGGAGDGEAVDRHPQVVCRPFGRVSSASSSGHCTAAAAAGGEMLLGDCRSYLYLTEMPFTGGLRKIGSQKWLDSLPSETERRDVPSWASLAALDS